MKNVTDFRKTVESGVDPHLDLFDEIVCNPTHSLHSLLPQRKSCKYALRRKSDFTLPLCKTERLKKSFIFSHVYKM